jgi:hypothetical protein
MRFCLYLCEYNCSQNIFQVAIFFNKNAYSHYRILKDTYNISVRHALDWLILYNIHSTVERVQFEVLTVGIMKTSILWDVTLFRPLKVSRSFGGKCRPSFLSASCWFLAWLIRQPRRWRRTVPSKRYLNFNRLLGVVSQRIYDGMSLNSEMEIAWS